MKKLIIVCLCIISVILGLSEYETYEKQKSIKNCQITDDEKSLIYCFEYPLKNINEKMIMIINHKNFKFSDSDNLTIYLRFAGLALGEHGECFTTPECKAEFGDKAKDFQMYLMPIAEQCKKMINNECKEIYKKIDK